MNRKIRVFCNDILQNSFWGKLFKNFVVIFVGNNYASLLNMVSLFFILLILDAKEYGFFVLGQSYMAVIDALINFQSWQGVIRYGSFALEEENRDQLSSVIKTGLCIDVVTCVLGMFVGLLLIDGVAYVFRWEEITKKICILFSLEILFHVEGSVTGILRLFNRFNFTMFHSFIYATINFASILIYYLCGERDLLTFVYIYVLTDIIKHCTYQIFGIITLKKELGLKRVLKAPFLSMKSEYYRYTIWSNLTATADVPIKYFDVFFLSFISVQTVASYKLFKQLVHIMGVLATPISQAIMPQLSELIAKNEKRNAYEKVCQIKKMFMKILIPTSVLVAIVSVFLFKSFKDGIYYKDIYILFLLLILNIGTFSNVGIHPLFSAYGFSKEGTMITLFANCVYVFICAVTIRELKVIGIIAATFIQFLITVSLKKHIIVRRMEK